MSFEERQRSYPVKDASLWIRNNVKCNSNVISCRLEIKVFIIVVKFDALRLNGVAKSHDERVFEVERLLSNQVVYHFQQRAFFQKNLVVDGKVTHKALLVV